MRHRSSIVDWLQHRNVNYAVTAVCKQDTISVFGRDSDLYSSTFFQKLIVAMARALFSLVLVLLATCAIADAHTLSAYTTTAKAARKPASVKLVVHNVADRTLTFTCAELGKDAKPVTADKGQWTAIGPIDVTVEENFILHLTVTVGTGQRYGFVKKSLVINLLKQFQYNLEGSKFLVLTAIENARERSLKLRLGKRVVLTFNLY